MYTVFIVDDSPIVRRILQKGLLSAQFGYEEAGDGEEALNKIKGGLKPSIVVTDVNMPKMDGLTLIQELRKLPATRFVPILVLTTEHSSEKKGIAKAAGATGWLTKPCDWETLYKAMQQVLPSLR